MTSCLRKTYLTALAFFLMGLFNCQSAAWAGLTVLTVTQGSFAPVVDKGSATTKGPVDAVPASAAVPASSAGPGASSGSQGFELNLNEGRKAAHYESPKIYTGERISLDFQNAEIHNIIRIIGEVSGKNIVVSEAVSGKVTLKLKDVPWDQALDIVLASRNLGVEESGNVLTIYDLPTLNNIRAGRDRVAAERAAAMAMAPLEKRVFTPKYAPISQVTMELNKLKSERGKIAAIGNDIYVEDEPGIIATMSQIILRVDRVARQILIEARIIEATATFVNRLGIDWKGAYNGGGNIAGITGSTGSPGSASGSLDIVSTGAKLGFGFINKANSLMLNATIRASETASEARTISAPRIMAANDQKVMIKQGKQIPYQSGSSATTAANTEFKEVVMSLEVEPHIEENGQIVTLDIKLTNDTPDTASGADGNLAINKREAETKLMVKDGETVVIGGIIVDSQTEGVSRVPGVHRIPIIGWLFQQRNMTTDKSEMLIFITANIIPINL